MKKKTIFSGFILIFFGLFYYLQRYEISFLEHLSSWPTLLIVVGLAFLLQAYFARDDYSIFPGVILTGFGLHFYLIDQVSTWPDDVGIFIFIIGFGLLLQHRKTGVGLFFGFLFLVLSIVMLFYNNVIEWTDKLTYDMTPIFDLWPFLFIFSGIYLLFFKRA